jgi:hypothetical protein
VEKKYITEDDERREQDQASYVLAIGIFVEHVGKLLAGERKASHRKQRK